MMKKRSKFFLATAVTLVLVTSLIPRGVYGIKNISLVREAEAQEEGGQGAGGILQSILPMLAMLMMMGMMNKKGQGPGEGKVGEAQKAATKTLANAGSQSNGGGTSGAQPSVPNLLTPNGTNPINSGGININIPLS